MIRIVDYGLGNILAFLNVFKRLNIAAGVARDATQLADAEKLVLPGVGAFDYAMRRLNDSGLRQMLDSLVIDKQVPVLGVCVGMQMLARSSAEGSMPGLGWVKGEVRHFRELGRSDLRIPHMGWNDVKPRSGSKLFGNLHLDARFYFLHSYYFECDQDHDKAATSAYGAEFCCAVSSGTIHGVQFHPEKSHHFGVQLLKNFAEL
jgi:imidazole glycerol-phosphate synthase subunit HisH